MCVAKSVMTEEVICLAPETTVRQAIETLIEHKISGAPVVDSQRRLVGIISEFQLMEIVFDPTLREQAIGEFMTRDVISVGEDAPLSELVALFVVHRIRRIPVVRDGRLVGLIARRDVVEYANAHADAMPPVLSASTNRE